MLPMYGVPKPFSDTCHGHGNIALTVEVLRPEAGDEGAKAEAAARPAAAPRAAQKKKKKKAQKF